MRNLNIIIVIVTFALFANVNLKAQFVDHDNDGWWDISSYSDLVLLSSNSAYWSGQYEISHGDIIAPTFPLQNFSPIGNNQVQFSGKFRGYDPLALDDNVKHRIWNIREYWLGFDNMGLFGVNTGEITDVVLCSFNITGRNNTGALCGTNEGLIKECEFHLNLSLTTTTVTGNQCVGGMVGWNNGGSIIDCHPHMTPLSSYTYVSVAGAKQVGGLIGSNCPGLNNSVSNCEVYNISVNGISDRNEIGGFVGFNLSELSNCYVRGFSSVNDINTFSVSPERVGGFVGNNLSQITNCQVGDSVIVDAVNSYYVGGFAGRNFSDITLSSTGASVSGWHTVGGFCGLDSGNVSNSKSTGSVSASGYYVGGFVGLCLGDIDHCYVTETASVIATNANYVGGFVGMNEGLIQLSCTKADTVAGHYYVGGFVGENIYQVVNSYSRAPVSGVDTVGGFSGSNIYPGGLICVYSACTSVFSPGVYRGGLCGYSDNGWFNCCRWDEDLCRLDESAGGIGLTTYNMKWYLPWSGWDLNYTWEFTSENDGYLSFIDVPVYKINIAKNENMNNIDVYPNPVNEISSINVSDSEKGFTTLTVYNTNGEKLETLYSGDINTNEYALNFNGNNYTTGMYYLVLESNNSRKIEPIVVKH